MLRRAPACSVSWSRQAEDAPTVGDDVTDQLQVLFAISTA
jgi:hypothetical protein